METITYPDFKAFRYQSDDLDFEVIEHGGTVTYLAVPDRAGTKAPVLLTFDSPIRFLGRHPHFNCLVGRYSNRITDARFSLDGATYALDANIPPHQLHGGHPGFGWRHWKGRAIDDNTVKLSLHSPDGEAGYPGNLEVTATYTVAGSTVSLTLEAETDAPTPVSLTSHPYFNLSGNAQTTIDDHLIAVNADYFLPVSEHLTQLGEIRAVQASAFDLREPVLIGEARQREEIQLSRAGGFDHTFAINGGGMRYAASIEHPPSGRRVAVSTDQPGIQVYTSNTLDDFATPTEPWLRYGAVCLEAQQFPDAPNQPNYPDPTLRPGERFIARTIFSFEVAKKTPTRNRVGETAALAPRHFEGGREAREQRGR